MHRLEIELQILGGKTTPRQHIGACLKLGAVIFALTLLTWAFFSQGLIVGIAVSLAFATAAFAYHFTSPARQLALEAGKIEKHLPFCLMQLSEELNSGIAMEGALIRAANGGYGELSALLSGSLLARRGASVQEALAGACTKTSSAQLRRCISHVISVYEHGSKDSPAQAIREIALDSLHCQKAQAKEFSARLSVLSVAFIALSAIAPALLQSFIVVGGSFMDIGFGAEMALLVIAVLLPAADIIFLLYTRSLTPEFLKEGERKWDSGIDEMLKRCGMEISKKDFLGQPAALGALFMLLTLYYGLFIAGDELIAALSIPVFFLPIAISYSYLHYIYSSRLQKIGEAIPDMLLLAASLPEHMGIQRIISRLAENEDGPLNGEFAIAAAEISNGMPTEQALLRISERNPSLPLARAIGLMAGSLSSGTAMGSVFRQAAQDFLETNSLLRERAANTAVQKYTLLFAGGLLVPLILGTVSSLAAGFDFGQMDGIGLGVDAAQKMALNEAVQVANIAYIAEYALIASAFIAFQEGKSGKAFLYALFLVPAGMLAYFAGKGF